MADIETLGVLEEIEVLVSVKLQVVSYKWLSRNYLFSSDAAKKLLQEFVEKHGSGLEVVYTLSGWLKDNSQDYHIRLVPGTKIADAKQEFEGNCSVQVYSVQACIPKDSAALWNAEFVQAEELFMQPSAVDNCLRDNRFCGISNSFVKRNAEGGTPASNTAPQPKTPGVPGSSKSNSAHHAISAPQLQQRKVQQPSPKVGLQSPNIAIDIKSESKGREAPDQASKPPTNKEKRLSCPPNEKKNSTGTGGSLANLWGRASSKPKLNTPPAETSNLICDPTVSAEDQICTREVVEGGSSDDDGKDVNFKRASSNEGGRKRRVVFDYSDEEDITEDAVSLASPDLPKGQSCYDSKHSTKTLAPKKIDLNTDKQNKDKPKIQDEKTTENLSNQPFSENFSVLKGKNIGVSSSENIHFPVPINNEDKKGKVTTAAPNSPKRRKVLKTRIDERGREVIEVVWEGEERETEKAEAIMRKKADNNAATNAVNRAPATKKSPAVGNTAPSGGKAGNKKAGNSKDPKQGNILSFFKRV